MSSGPNTILLPYDGPAPGHICLAESAESLANSIKPRESSLEPYCLELRQSLWSLSELLHNLEPDLLATKSNDPGLFAEALGAISHWLADLRRILERSSESIDLKSNQGPTVTGNIEKKDILDLERTLLCHINVLTLSLRLARSVNKEAVNKQGHAILQKLDSFSQWLFEAQDDIFPATLPTAGGESYRDEMPTFSLHKTDLSIQTDLARRTEGEVCPNAALPIKYRVTGRKFQLNFQCLCKDAHHSNLMEYRGVTVMLRSMFVEEVSARQSRNWEIMLWKGKSPVLIQIKNVTSNQFLQLETFSKELAVSCAKVERAAEDRTTNWTSNIYGNISEQSTSVLRTKLTPTPSTTRLLNQVEMDSSTPLRLSKPPPQIEYLLHYDVASSVSLKKVTVDFSGKIFSSESYFEILMTRAQLQERYRIQVYHDTEISISVAMPMVVTISSVRCIYSGHSSGSVDCSAIRFQFTAGSAADEFLKSLKHMQQRLLQKVLQRKCSGEEIVYRQDSEISTGDPIPPLLRRQLNVVFDPRKSRYRMVLSRNDSPNSICFDVGIGLFEDIDRGLSECAKKYLIWTIERNDSGEVALHKRFWRELISRGKSKKPQSHGGRVLFAQSDSEISSKTWLNELGDLTAVIQGIKRREIDDQHKRVKIAVLDTGLRNDHPLSGKVKYQDFVNKQAKTKIDLTHHGTDSVNLILQAYDAATLYVARIFEGNSSDEKSGPPLMAEAINWAVDEGVNIISISAGFHGTAESISVLFPAVTKAAAAGILIFAAASNWGNKDKIAYPAAFKDQVMCIFSTNGANRFSRDFNPDPRKDADNFAILGENVELYDEKPPLKGTSVATPIAAGLAGHLIDFSRQIDCREAIQGVGLVATKSGMTAIFKKISVGDREGYNCIIPSNLLDYGHKEMKRPDNRARVRDRISSALKKVT